MDDFDLTPRNRESTVEDGVIEWAENNGWLARAMGYRGRVGCRDYDFYGFGQVVMMEFKRQGRGKRGLSTSQARERDRLLEKGIEVHVVDSVDQGKAILRRHRKAGW